MKTNAILKMECKDVNDSLCAGLKLKLDGF